MSAAGCSAGRHQPYESYKQSGIEWLDSIPIHWTISRLSELAEVLNGYPFDSQYFIKGEGIPLVRIRDMHATETEVGYIGQVIDSAWIEFGDVIIGMDGDFNVARWQGPRALLNQRMCCLRPRHGSDPGFLAYAVPFPLKAINDLTYSTTVKHLSSVDVRRILIGTPPPEEQRTIAMFLDRQTERIDELLSRKERLIELLQEKRAALITRAVTKGLDPTVPMKDSTVEWLGQVPAHWTLSRLKDITMGVEQGWSPLCDNRQAGADEWGVLKAGCVNGAAFDEMEHKALPADQDPQRELEIRPGDILMSRANTRQLLGSAALVRQVRPRLLLCDKLYRIRARAKFVSPSFLVLAFSSSLSRFQFEREATGASASMQNIPQQMLLNLVLPCPPPGEQTQIVELVERDTALLSGLIKEVRRAIARLEELRTALISAAVTGKIDVRAACNPVTLSSFST